MKLFKMGEKLFDVVPVLASVSCMTYFVFSSVYAFVDQGNHLVPVSLLCLKLSERSVKREKKKRFSGWELCFSLWSVEPQNICTLCSVPAEHFSSSSVHDKVYIMICKVFWEGEILWQETCHPQGGFLFLLSLLPDPVLPFPSLCPIVFSSVNHRKQMMFGWKSFKITTLCYGGNFHKTAVFCYLAGWLKGKMYFGLNKKWKYTNKNILFVLTSHL